MIIIKKIENNIYIIFREGLETLLLINKIEETLIDISEELKNKIKNFLNRNKLDENSIKRQKNYVSYLKTYIDIIEGFKPVFLHIYIIPKDIIIKYDENNISDGTIKKIEKFCLDIFCLYNQHIELQDIEFKIVKEYKGNNFLELEIEFYIREFEQLYNYLLNYKKNLRDKIVVSDKQLGIPIDELNRLEEDNSKIYQFVKVPYQNDLVIFIFSLIEFFKEYRLRNFREHNLYAKIKNIVDKIYNFLFKISFNRYLKKEIVHSNNINVFFERFKKSPEICRNKKLFEIMEFIFLNQLNNGVFVFKSIDMIKMFEKIVEKNLRKTYGDNLNIGDESSQKFIGQNSETLKGMKYLLADACLPQYPDYVIKSEDIFHIVDAKYKIYNNLWKDSNAFRQILVYAKLFNKDKDIIKVNKMLVYVNNYNVDIDNYKDISLNDANITFNDDIELYTDTIFNSPIILKGVSIFK
ncbi:MAG: hypothetical protein ACYCSW_08750 [bacterium]